MIDLEKEKQEQELFKQKMLNEHSDYGNEEEFEKDKHGDFAWIGTDSDFIIWQMCAEEKQAEITELKQQIKGLKDLNIDLQYSRQRVRVELSDLDGVLTELKQKLEKIESGEFVLVPRKPTSKMIKKTIHELNLSGGTDILLDIYISMVEAVEKDHE